MQRAPDYVRHARMRLRRIVNAIGDGRVICERCGATWETFTTKCASGFSGLCQGARAIERAASGTEQA